MQAFTGMVRMKSRMVTWVYPMVSTKERRMLAQNSGRMPQATKPKYRKATVRTSGARLMVSKILGNSWEPAPITVTARAQARARPLTTAPEIFWSCRAPR